MTMVEEIQCNRRAGPGVLSRVVFAQNADHGRIPMRAISCLTVQKVADVSLGTFLGNKELTSHSRECRRHDVASGRDSN